MKTIKVDHGEDFEMWRELGAEEFARTPTRRLGSRLQRLTNDAKSADAGAEEKGLLAGFLEALTAKSDSELRKMGLSVSRGEKIGPKPRQALAVALSPEKRIVVGKVAAS